MEAEKARSEAESLLKQRQEVESRTLRKEASDKEAKGSIDLAGGNVEGLRALVTKAKQEVHRLKAKMFLYGGALWLQIRLLIPMLWGVYKERDTHTIGKPDPET